MAFSVGNESHGVRTFDVDVNLVPFIDLMSCLVAFLLVTAVWTDVARLPLATKGVGGQPAASPAPPQRLAILVERDALWLGASSGRTLRIDVGSGDVEAFARLTVELRSLRQDGAELELAANDGVPYQQIVRAMDAAIDAGFPQVAVTEPNELSVRFTH